jgi:tetratricopeptide (TPR) repeat protein
MLVMGRSLLAVRVLVISQLFVFFAGTITWANTADEWYWRGYEYDALSNYDEAISCYKKAIGQNPDFSDAYYRLGLVYEAKGLFNEAIANYKQLIALDPSYVNLHYNLGVAYNKKGSLDEAIAAYKKVIFSNPRHFDARIKLCTACKDNGMLDEALEECQEVISINPEFAKGYENLGIVYFNKGMYVLSAKHFYRAASISIKDLCKTVFLFLISLKAVLRYLTYNLTIEHH